VIQLTDEMKRLVNNAREDGFPCIVATASRDGTPNAGYIGTVLAVDDSTFVYRDRTRRQPLEHIEENPKVIVLFRNSDVDAGWKFRCTASVERQGEMYYEMTQSLADSGLISDPEMVGAAIVVLHIDQVLTLFGEVLQEREPGMRW
jgi:predicted pyridoxine 5'-phosphate oxidase superfamily flavin-nucleotide-binding protein